VSIFTNLPAHPSDVNEKCTRIFQGLHEYAFLAPRGVFNLFAYRSSLVTVVLKRLGFAMNRSPSNENVSVNTPTLLTGKSHGTHRKMPQCGKPNL